MKIVLDTNVLVAALGTQGLCSDILEYCLRYPRILILSQPILAETQQILVLKFKLPRKISMKIVADLKALGEYVQAQPVTVPQLRDKDDEAIIATALSARAKIIVTGDQDLLVLKNYDDISILSPRQFYQTYYEQSA
jgi:putative PIN family toxin of toxin-antitoxin system